MKIAWPPLLLVVWTYAGILLSNLQIQAEVFTNVPWQVWMAGAALLCVVNVICALRRKMHPALSGMIAKLLLIPFYVVSLFFGLILFAMPAVMLLIFLLDGLYLLATSAYTLRGLYQTWRGGGLPAGWAIVLGISQLIFVLDVPGSIVLYAIEKRRSH